MTNSSSEGSAAPLDFHLSTSLEVDSSKLSSNTEDCPLCCKSRKTFYCKMCIRNGDFVHSTSHYVERFAEKQLRLMHMKRDRRDAEIMRGKQIDAFQHRTRLSGGIKMHKERISLLHLLIKDTRETVEKSRAYAAQLADTNMIGLMRLKRYEERVRKLEGYVRDKSSEVEKQQQKVKIVCSELKKVVRMSISQLVQYIFPISVVKPTRSQEDCDTISALAEATRTAYFRGRWVFMDSSGELQHCIVAPTLPGSGNYSPYNDWVAANKDGVPGSSSGAVDYNLAYSISAALMYTTQLINVLAFYLDVRLPSKLCYSDFCGNDLSEQKFMKRVARLNWNVLHLCLTQSVNPQLLHPSQTLHNILHLLNTQISDLGRLGPVEVEPVIAKALEEQLLRRLEEASDDSDSEDDSDHLPCEWEAVPHVSLPEAPMPSQMSQAGMSTSSSASTNSVQATSIAGGLVTSAAASIASIWRGWTAGNR